MKDREIIILLLDQASSMLTIEEPGLDQMAIERVELAAGMLGIIESKAGEGE